MGSLSGYTAIELAGIGPGPMAGMMLSDMGARVILVERMPGNGERGNSIGMRGKESIAVNLKHPEGLSVILKLVERADVLIDPYRPGVCERLGLGPEVCLERNPGLVYGRITGWGQDGPLANSPGHDLGYLSITGALHAIGEDGAKPQIPLNMVADMGGGGMLLLNGILAALLERGKSGRGQVVDAAMVDGAILQLISIHEMIGKDSWDPHRRGVNLLDGGAHHYNVYECANGKFITISALEHKFHAFLLDALGLDQDDVPNRNDPSRWPAYRELLSSIFKTRSRHEWCELLEGTDACLSPVLDLEEAPRHPANRARSSHVTVDGIVQPAPAPRFSRTDSLVRHGAPAPGEHTRSILLELGVKPSRIGELVGTGTVG
ncbi:MAG: CoA transferase [Gammaproteobacteria bacterium]|nr:CoA transferase [Gammaproteobacteria bacterium]